MPPKKRISKRIVAPARGSLRVQAWLHSAIWPLLEAAEHELDMLGSGDITWRRAHRKLDALRPAIEYLPRASRANLLDMLQAEEAEDVTAAIEAHAEAIHALEGAATAAQAALEAGYIKTALTSAAKKEARKLANPEIIAHIAERVVNKSDHAFGVEGEAYAALAPALPGFYNLPELRALEDARVSVQAATEDLVGKLETLQAVLCDAYDLPPAPPHAPPDRHR